MSFNATIPVVTDPILQSSAQMRANFQAIDRAFAINHVGLTRDQSTLGKHTVVNLQDQKGLDPATTATQIAIYNNLVSTIPQLFYRPNNSQIPIQLTYQSYLTGNDGATPPVWQPNQFSFMAGPFIVYLGLIPGSFSVPIVDGTIVTLTPASTLIYVDLIGKDAFRFLGGVAFTLTPTNLNAPANSFTIRISDPVVFSAYYLAIGLP